MKITKFILTIVYSPIIFCQVWINEISYEMTGGDTDDFIEIVAPVNTDMSTFGILLANGEVDADESYNYIQLSGTISSTNSNNGFGFFILLTSQSSSITVPVGVASQASGFSSIQNGAPDGILLLNHTTAATVHGIWYEESGSAPSEITRISTGSPPGTGPYSMTGVDVTSLGESGSSISGGSLSMLGVGNSGTWEVTISGTPGIMNTNQSALPVELSSFSASIIKEGLKLNWKTETEVNNYGFEIERSENSAIQNLNYNWIYIGFVPGYGNSNSPKNYSFNDLNVQTGEYSYRLKQIDNDGSFTYSKAINIDFDAPLNYELNQNYPNPFNPITTIKFILPEESNVRLTVFNTLGEEVTTLINRNMERGIHTVNFNADRIMSGMYFYKLETAEFTQVKKMILNK